MRASKRAAKRRGQTIATLKTKPIPDTHISGAEGICQRKEIQPIVQEYIDRAVAHPRGKPDSIVITIEELKKPLRSISALPVMTVKCGSSSRAEAITGILLRSSGVSMKAITSALSILQNRESMRGASLVLASSGQRVEPDMLRGVRASRFGIAGSAEKALTAELNMLGINTQTVREALVLASKVASCRDVMAEVCISDDPDYTTGYVASEGLGYIRIPHIKKKRDRRGGRIFFIREAADIPGVIAYLEKTPVIIQSIKPCPGEKNLDEIIDCHHQ
ncbi:MAG: 6-carboxyhexanoate--CoA ligase [Nitrospirae bacterium]|nr:6-carboxyhexanoate--CoA ligase [Nitrospirota bacterium]